MEEILLFIERNATTLNIILGLFIAFQWLQQHAKEQSVKNNLFAVRRILDSVPGSEAAVATLDAALATLGARNPFIKKFCEVRDMIIRQFKEQETAPLLDLQNEKIQKEKNDNKRKR